MLDGVATAKQASGGFQRIPATGRYLEAPRRARPIDSTEEVRP
jgi:hypothetical protein